MLRIIKDTIFSPLQEIIRDSRSIGIILFLCSIVSLVCSNTSFGEEYLKIWQYEFHFPSFLHLPHSVLHWVNDGLMAIFFFLVGMEIKREVLKGELSSFKNAILPIAAAIGGMIMPAFIYFLVCRNTAFAHGWGIPMATDIAFSLGIASLLGSRVPVSLKIFLTALAIIDDLGAIAMIAIFYGGTMEWIYFLAALGIILLLVLLLKFKVKFGVLQIILGLLLWYCIFNSGIHATLAGVIFAFCVPLENLESIEHRIHVPVNFAILPIFALANTAIILPPDIAAAINTKLSWGIELGLFFGKPLGIVLACFILVKFKWGSLPASVNWPQIFGVGFLAGIGFTMSLFIATLAFKNPAFGDISKIGVLLGSLASMVVGFLCLYFFSKRLTAGE